MTYELEPQVTEGGRTKQRILETALSLFCAEGYDRASLRHLADRLDFTPAAVYYHFSSKADILHAVLAPLLDDLDAVLADPPATGDPAGRRALLEQVIDALLAHREILALLVSDVSVARCPGIEERLASQNRQLVEALGGPKVDTVGRIRVAAALGALRRPLLDLPDLDLAAHRDVILDSVLAALDPPQ